MESASKCPYVWIARVLTGEPTTDGTPARFLCVTVDRDGERTVEVRLPARSARWLLELIPTDVLAKIRAENIPIDQMQAELAAMQVLSAQQLFTLSEPRRKVCVWLE